MSIAISIACADRNGNPSLSFKVAHGRRQGLTWTSTPFLVNMVGRSGAAWAARPGNSNMNQPGTGHVNHRSGCDVSRVGPSNRPRVSRRAAELSKLLGFLCLSTGIRLAGGYHHRGKPDGSTGRSYSQ